ncbi:MAG: hypothetical protein M1837_006613 [Sclerophora amabilis]|nr:MAG: hypothetical protein M1837_006613 [Sclerophora amabilis]
MLVKKPAILCSSYHSFHSLCGPSHQVNTSSPPPSTYRSSSRRKRNRRPCTHRRGYATLIDDFSHGLVWPELANAKAVPTPYQIFNQKKGAPYCKRRFYDLVKLYHPDRNGHDKTPSSTSGLPHDLKLERYRLIVAANDILSDPVKRTAYDRYGAGWNGQPEVRGSWSHRNERQAGKGFAGGFWGGGPGDPSPHQNATWEDWERWYQRDSKSHQRPQFFGNGTFLSLVVVFAALGGFGQATRAENFSTSMIERRDQVHDQSSRDLIRRRKGAPNSSGQRDERIQSFLRMRDPVGFGITDPVEDNYRRLLPEPEVCSSGDIKDRQMAIYHSRDKGE